MTHLETSYGSCTSPKSSSAQNACTENFFLDGFPTSETASMPRIKPQTGLTPAHKRKRAEADDASDSTLSGGNTEDKPVTKIRGDGKSKATSPPVSYQFRTQQMAEDYVTFVGDLMYPRAQYGPFGYNHENGKFPVERITALGYLMSPVRRPTVIEKWSPLEISLFEGAMMLYGKKFHVIQKIVKTKTTAEVIEFYYVWKKTSHYKIWKRSYVPDDEEQK